MCGLRDTFQSSRNFQVFSFHFPQDPLSFLVNISYCLSQLGIYEDLICSSLPTQAFSLSVSQDCLDNLGFLGSLLCTWVNQPSMGRLLIEPHHGLLISRTSLLNFKLTFQLNVYPNSDYDFWLAELQIFPVCP